MTQGKTPARLSPRERSALAKRVEAIYTFERNTWHHMHDRNFSNSGGQPVRYWQQSGNRSNVWSSLADLYHMNSICIHTYIYYVFFLPEYIERPPTPKEIYPHQRLGKFQEFVNGKTHELSWQFRYYTKELNYEVVLHADMHKKRGESVNDLERRKNSTFSVLLGNSRNIPAIFKYAAGRHLENDAVCEAHLTGAAVAYSRHRKSYDAEWGFLPPEWRHDLLREMDRILESQTGISISSSESGK